MWARPARPRSQSMYSGGFAPGYGAFTASTGLYAGGLGVGNNSSSMVAAAMTRHDGSGGGGTSRARRASVAEQHALPALGSAEEQRHVEAFRREHSELVAALPPEWTRCCLRLCAVDGAFDWDLAARRMRLYRDWREHREVEMLGNPLNGGVRELLLGGGVLLTGARDLGGRPILTIFAREIGVAATGGSWGGRASGSSTTEDMVLACHWLLECAVHTWPECQRLGVAVLVDGTGVEDDAVHCAGLSAWLGQVVVALKHSVPVAVALLLGLNCGGRLHSLWREFARQVTAEGGMAEAFAPLSSDESVAALRPHVGADQLLADHGGTMEWSHAEWCEQVDATMCDEDWPWPTVRPVPSLEATGPLASGRGGLSQLRERGVSVICGGCFD
jgi:hypothetical protein